MHVYLYPHLIACCMHGCMDSMPMHVTDDCMHIVTCIFSDACVRDQKSLPTGIYTLQKAPFRLAGAKTVGRTMPHHF